ELPELVEFFVRQYALHYNKPEVALSQETLRLFAEYPWPANLQELEAAVKRIVMLENEAMVCQELIRAMRHPESTSQEIALDRPSRESSPRATETVDSPATTESSTAAMPLKKIAREAADG